MGDILSLEGRTRPEIQKEGIVDRLSNWLELAKKGEIESLAMVSILRNGNANICSVPGDRIATTIGAVAMLQHELLKDTEDA